MRKYALSLVVCGACLSGWAQRDSSRLDAGYVTLDRHFTQQLTIPGADLEKMPFSNLSDAIAVWLYGAYIQPTTLMYIVDGFPVGDVNAYPIQDIESVTLVQDASALVATGGTQQQVVLVRTKQEKGAKGMKVAVQPGRVDGNGDGPPAGAGLFQHYYASAFLNQTRMSYRVSADYLRDGWLTRWRFNGWYSWRPNAANRIEVQVNYTPQALAWSWAGLDSSMVDEAIEGAHQRYFLPRASWHFDAGKGLRNDFQAAYLNSKYDEDDVIAAISGNISSQLETIQYAGTVNSYHLLVRDHLEYEAVVGGWRLEPALDVRYEHYNDEVAQYTAYGTNYYYYSYESNGGEIAKGDAVFAAPAVDLRYREVLDLQGGALVNAGHLTNDSVKQRVFPFVRLAVDLLRASGRSGGASLKLFGSWAERTSIAPASYTLANVDNGLFTGLAGDLATTPAITGITGPVGPYPTIPVAVPPGYWVWDAGAGYSSNGGQWRVQYLFERRNYVTSGYKNYYVPGLPYDLEAPTLPQWRSDMHHLSVEAVVPGDKEAAGVSPEGMEWRSGISLTLLRSSVDTTGSDVIEKPDVGDVSPAGYSWVGGWGNRLRVGHVVGGLDLLWRFGETMDNGERLNSVMLANVYAGYRFGFGRAGKLELFVESRGKLRSTNSDLLDRRQYYTAGGILQL
jgi:hypothetical protein